MAHKIVELAPVGSQWKCRKGETFFRDRVLTIVRHDLNERRIRYVYDDMQEMSKSFDTFERECEQGNITRVGEAAPKATVALCTGDVIKTAARNCGPFSGNSELTILEIDSVHGRVKYEYKNGPVISPGYVYTKDLSQFHDFLRRGLMTVIGRAAKEPHPEAVPVQVKNPFHVPSDELFKTAIDTHRHSGVTHMSVAERFEEVRKKLRGMPMTQSTKTLAHQMMRDVMPAGVEWELEFVGNDMNLRFRPTARKMVEMDYGAIEARALAAMSLQAAEGSTLDRLLATYGDQRVRIEQHKPGLESWLKPKLDGNKAYVIVTDEIKPEVKSEEKPMTRIVNVFLMDTTAGLKASERLIGKVENFATDSRNDTTLLLEMSMEHNLAEMLKAHNLKRKSIINQDILNRVGKTVYLQPIEMSDVKIDIKLVTGL
ncbi:hypothetical protein PP651_gp13 [Aeromonas phage ZPAH14]|uniref:Uncharacterized protein n=1 Tax=Aeromonas phage ZPAH14 TaxID=2924887 RepID=A0AAE9H0Y7_9CAUD|nr:hypothetical protein PP651_gp13 [Aeromonas phage ZPAH14]UOT58005.1 hypothetical protein [Aeromonas phage ZPAH14]